MCDHQLANKAYFSDITVKTFLVEFYPQDGGESQLALKLRHCHPYVYVLPTLENKDECAIDYRKVDGNNIATDVTKVLFSSPRGRKRKPVFFRVHLF